MKYRSERILLIFRFQIKQFSRDVIAFILLSYLADYQEESRRSLSRIIVGTFTRCIETRRVISRFYLVYQRIGRRNRCAAVYKCTVRRSSDFRRQVSATRCRPRRSRELFSGFANEITNFIYRTSPIEDGPGRRLEEHEGEHERTVAAAVVQRTETEARQPASTQLHRRCAETAQFRGYVWVMHYRLAVQRTLHGADRIAFR